MKSLRYCYRFAAGLLLLLLAVPPAGGQVKDRQHTDRLESARKLYYSGSYYAAEKAFTELSQESERTLDKTEIEAYKVLCAIALDKVNAEGLVNTFCNKFPNAPQQAMVREALASRYFDTGHYAEALAIYDVINPDHLYTTQRTGYTFKKAYSQMRTGKYDEAVSGFGKVIRSPHSQYTVPATYYGGYVHYIRKEFGDAVSLFDRVGEGNQFSLMAQYFATESQFMRKQYNDVVRRGERIYGQLDREMQSSLARILSEAWYDLGDNEKAREYLDVYRASGAEMSRKDHYFSGILSYGLHAWKDAIASFSEVLAIDDELGQNAWYYTANSYLECRNKVAALDAFKKAASSSFDKVIQEDAFFNFAKLSFDVNSDISQFERYMEQWPDSGKDDIINNYMATSFLLSKDYDSAVKALSAIRNHTDESSANLQKATFFRALQLIDGKAYRSAAPLLETSIDSGENEPLRNLASFWLAECLYRDERYSEAISILGNLLLDEDFRRTSDYPQALYNQAYNYLKSGNYVYAENNFRNFLNVSADYQQYERDAQVRLGDACFLQNKYADAAAEYERVYAADPASDDLYPVLQAAIAYGLTGDDARKADMLRQAIRTSRNAPLYPQAVFELGRTYVQTGQDDDATECFFTLLGMKDSDYYLKALLELALINANNKKYDKAIEYYKTVVAAGNRTPEAEDALAGLESIYQLRNHPEDYLAYLDEIGLSDLKSSEEKEQMLFRAAEQLYLTGKYPAAINAVQRYLAQYPKGEKAPKATFYLAESLRETGRLESAADQYLKVMKSKDPSCRLEATAAYAKLNYDLQHYQKAADAYGEMADLATSPETKLEAYTGLMRSCFAGREFQEAIRYAGLVGGREADFIQARSWRTLGERDKAQALFERLAADCNDEIGAESAYTLVLDAYDRGDLSAVEERVYAFSDAGTSQVYWLAKSFIVLGDAFADRGDVEQAEATYNSILDGYEPAREGDDVLDQVQRRLEQLKRVK